MRRFLLSLGILAITAITGCTSPPGDSVGGGGTGIVISRGGGSSGSSRPMISWSMNTSNDKEVKTNDEEAKIPLTAGNVPGVVEVHGVVFRKDCRNMFEKAQQQGRRINKWRVVSSPNPNSDLKWLCGLFGPDADDGTYEDYRYNSREEYQAP